MSLQPGAPRCSSLGEGLRRASDMRVLAAMLDSAALGAPGDRLGRLGRAGRAGNCSQPGSTEGPGSAGYSPDAWTEPERTHLAAQQAGPCLVFPLPLSPGQENGAEVGVGDRVGAPPGSRAQPLMEGCSGSRDSHCRHRWPGTYGHGTVSAPPARPPRALVTAAPINHSPCSLPLY